MRARALRSGSSGNLFLFEHNGTELAVDCGVNGKSFAAAMADAGIPEDRLNKLAGILVTHEHSDHISGLGVVMRRYRIPVYMNRKTFEAASRQLGKIDLNLVRLIQPEEKFTIGDLEITPFRTSHDAADPMGYTIECERSRAALCTDLGMMQDQVMNHLKGSRLVFLEANYEPDLLDNGPYPYYLKQRIRSERGHLSNEDSAAVSLCLLQNGTEYLVLSHLSRENNYPAMAELVVRQHLSAAGAGENDYRLSVAQRYMISECQILD